VTEWSVVLTLLFHILEVAGSIIGLLEGANTAYMRRYWEKTQNSSARLSGVLRDSNRVAPEYYSGICTGSC